jgi:hypothetical protein
LGFETIKIWHDVFWKDLVGYKYATHMVRLLWSTKAAFGAFVEATEFAAFSVSFNLDFTALWAQEFCGFAAWRDWFSATCTCD